LCGAMCGWNLYAKQLGILSQKPNDLLNHYPSWFIWSKHHEFPHKVPGTRHSVYDWERGAQGVVMPNETL